MRVVERGASTWRVPLRVTPIAAGIAIYFALAEVDPITMSAPGAARHLAIGALTLAVAAAVIVDAALHVAADREGPRALTAGRALLPLHLSLGSAAALFLLAEPVIGWAAYPLLLAPLIATQHAFRQLGSVRRTFDQTIDSLSRIPEIAGYSHAGHAGRVRALARATGRALRLSDRELDEIDVAARLHDLGRLQAQTPEAISTLDAAKLASGGASVVRMTGALPGVARIIEHQHDRFADRHGTPDRAVPIGSQVVRIASAFDDLTATGPDAHTPQDALAIIGHGRGTRFDPAILDAFSQIVTARNVPRASGR